MTQTPPGPVSSGAPPGWYPDPYYPQTPAQRYWDGQAWTPHSVIGAAGPATTPDGQLLSGWWARVLARLIDGLLMFVVSMVVAIPVMVQAWGDLEPQLDGYDRALELNPAEAFPDISFSDRTVALFIVWAVATFLIGMAYEVLFLRWKQATLGKMALRIQVRLRDQPGRLPWSAIWLRFLTQYWTQLVGWIPMVGSAAGMWPLLDDLWPLWDSHKQALHDKAARTNVVKVVRR